jgi:hypothetical protein
MAKAETVSSRLPRGTKPVSQAFFTALEAVPEASRIAVAKAAYAMIRDGMKAQRDKLKARAAREKAFNGVVATRSAVTKPRKTASKAGGATALKRPIRKSAATTSVD